MLLAFRRFIASLLVVSLAGIGLPLPVHAGMVSTDAVIASAERDRIASVLERAEVRAALERHGVSPAQVEARIAAMSDDEAAQLAAQIDALPAGGADLIGAIVLVFLVLLITDILGFTKIFPFTKSVR